MRLILLTLALLCLAGCGKAPAQREPVASPRSVRMSQVILADEPLEIDGVGTVALRRETELGFTTSGRVARITVNEGDRVRSGQILAALDQTVVASGLATATAERERAAAEYRRSEELIQSGWITRPRLESARAAYRAADAAVRNAGYQRDAATVTAPGPGVVLARLAEPGQVLPAGAPVLVLGEEASGYVLRVPLTDRDTTRIAPGALAQVTLEALGPEPVGGNVIEISGRADKATGTFFVEVALPPRSGLRSGQIGRVHIQARRTGKQEGILIVPPAAIFAARAGQAFTYVYDGNTRRVRLRRVTVSDTSDAGVAVMGGVRPGEWVAVSGLDRLRDGMAVQAIRAWT